MKKPAYPLLDAVAKLVSEKSPEWHGSATDLLCTLPVAMSANALTRRLNIHRYKLLDDYGILYANKHGRSGSCISLSYAAAKE